MYKLNNETWSWQAVSVTKTNEDGSGICIPFDPANTDYKAYLKYVEQGGLVLPADAAPDEEQQ